MKAVLTTMQHESEKDVLDEDIEPSNDTTDWEARSKELENKIGRARDSRKSQKDKYETEIAGLKAQLELKNVQPESVKPDDKLLERLDKMALQVVGITEVDEVELFNKWKKDTGREADDIVGNSIFKKELEDLKIAKANQKATSDIQGGTGESGAKSTPEFWIAKATKGADGKLSFPEETPKELYPKIVAELGKNEPGASHGKLSFHDQ